MNLIHVLQDDVKSFLNGLKQYLKMIWITTAVVTVTMGIVFGPFIVLDEVFGVTSEQSVTFLVYAGVIFFLVLFLVVMPYRYVRSVVRRLRT